MPKLAIYIPKQEMREIERWRKHLNFSQIFMTALRREIQTRSRSAHTPQNELARAAEFYRHSLEQDSGTLVDAGYQLGASSVLECQLELPTIRSLLQIDAEDQLSDDQMSAICDAAGGEQRVRKIARKQNTDTRNDPTWRNLLCRGFLQGVADTWIKVCEQIRSEQEKETE